MYELSNHLGNVLTTVSDIKLTADGNADGVVDSYAALITSAQDYYPFGSLEPGRTYSSENYRFGFNGKENDNEVKGTGNSVDFGARIYDSRLGRWLSVDPLQKDYPDLSPYQFCANSPVLFIDPDGKKIFIYYKSTDENGKEITVGYEYGSKIKPPKDKYVRMTIRTLDKIQKKGWDEFGIIKGLSESNEANVAITETKNWYQSGDFIIEMGQAIAVDMDGKPIDIDFKLPPDIISWCPFSGYIDQKGENRQSAAVGLLHELGHKFYYILDPYGKEAYLKFIQSGYLTPSEQEEAMEEFKKTTVNETGDYHTYSDKWLITNVEPACKQGIRKNHKDGFFLKTKGGPFSTRGKEYGRFGKTGRVKDLKKH